jgi:uncharacterized protein (DUF1778 family)
MFKENAMTLELAFTSEVETEIRRRAAEMGQDVEDFILQAVAEKLADTDSQSSRSSLNNKWKEQLRAFIELHPVVTHFVDDSRESIYAGRGE